MIAVSAILKEQFDYLFFSSHIHVSNFVDVSYVEVVWSRSVSVVILRILKLFIGTVLQPPPSYMP